MATKAQHTPGPWRVEKALHQAGCFFVEPFGYQQCKTEEEYAANARLIAAAPALLEAAQALVGNPRPSAFARNRLRAAIAAATGEEDA